MQISLAKSIFRILIFSVFLTTLLILVTIWNVSTNALEEQLEEDLSLAQALFTRVIQERREQLLDSAYLLTTDFGFRQAVATRDEPTIDSMFRNHGSRINADLILLLDLEGNIITNVPDISLKGKAYPNKQVVSLVPGSRGFDEFQILNDKLYQVVLLPVRAPSLIGIAGIAVEYNQETLEELKELTAGEIVIRKTTADSKTLLLTTHRPEEIEDAVMDRHSHSWFDAVVYNKPVFITSKITLPQMNDSIVDVFLEKNVTPSYRQMASTQLLVIGISAIVILITLSLSLMFSRRISQPVASLVNLADKISTGDYEGKKSSVTKLKEIEELARALFRMRDNIALRENEIQFRAEHDMLTGLNNRSFLERALIEKLEKSTRFQVIGLCLIGFRSINDLYGFSNGDQCLKELALRLQDWSGVKCRLSGGDITLLLDSTLEKYELEALQNVLEEPIAFEKFSIPIKVALGVIEVDPATDGVESVFRRLNIVLDEAKSAPSSLLYYDAQQEEKYLRRLSVLTELKAVLQSPKDQLFLVYQPKLDFKTGKIFGVEALIRWNSDKLGFVPPDEFIGIAEQAGFIEQVTRWVMARAIRDYQIMIERGLDLTIALNMSTQDIENKALLETFEQLLATNHIHPKSFQLEMTESDLVADAETTINNLHELREEGFSLAIDDFGTGYSSLAYLKNLPVNTLKIDRAFVMQLAENQDDQTLVQNILSLAKSFNLTVVAEGIEDLESQKLLSKWGCDFGQGYYIARPLDLDSLTSFVKDWQKQGITAE